MFYALLLSPHIYPFNASGVLSYYDWFLYISPQKSRHELEHYLGTSSIYIIWHFVKPVSFTENDTCIFTRLSFFKKKKITFSDFWDPKNISVLLVISLCLDLFWVFWIGTVSIHMLQMIEETDLGKGVLGLYQDILKTGRTGIFMTESQALSPN